MERLSVYYMGLKLRSPFIAGSSGFTAKLENIIALERAGVGAVVLKSLFEEQINSEAEFLNEQSSLYPENMDYLYHYMREYSLDNYLNLIREAKQAVKIPIIASINCFGSGNWLSFAKEIENAGADALEVNIYSLPLLKARNSISLEDEYLSVVTSLTKQYHIPIAVKIGDNFTNLPRFVDSLKICGADAVVMFNKYYHPDIDLKTLSVVGANPFSKEGDYLRELRWIAIISSMVGGLDISASTGVLSSDDAIKMILSGAKTVQLCSALYNRGVSEVEKFIAGLNKFMDEKGFNSLEDFRGMLNYSQIPSPDKYERVQFLKTFGSQK
ncbi:MAG: dihydroorotate dehydrogenase-like protein [Bacteroidales bacterium]